MALDLVLFCLFFVHVEVTSLYMEFTSSPSLQGLVRWLIFSPYLIFFAYLAAFILGFDAKLAAFYRVECKMEYLCRIASILFSETIDHQSVIL